MTITELVKYQNDYLAHQKAEGVPKDSRSAAVGAYQMLYPMSMLRMQIYQWILNLLHKIKINLHLHS